MDVDAAVLWGVGQDWSVETIQVDDPQMGEVRVRIAATGLCHSDHHAVTGDMPVPFPIVGGHEGAGVVEAVGPGVTSVREGDHVVLAFTPPCGRCRYCASGRSNLCASAARATAPAPPNYRFHVQGRDATGIGGLGTFSPYAVVKEQVVVRIPDDISLEVASVLGCAVTTGWGSAVYLAETKPGDAVVVIGAGGVGVNAVQGARSAGAALIVAVDTSEFKRQQALAFGATHACASVEEARALLADQHGGRMADSAILSIGVATGEMISPLLDLVGPGGMVVITSGATYGPTPVELNLFTFAWQQKTLRGNVYGGVNVHRDIGLLLDLYRNGKLMLDELVTQRYKLSDINAGYADMLSGKNLRGIVVHDH